MTAKRLLDVSCALFGLTISAPLCVAIGLAIKLDSPGPVLFRQERVGRGFRRFRILKFRTMRTQSSLRGPLVTSGGDRRITRVGALLRSTKLDELPQLYNVLVGDMSLVGPRPEVPPYVEAFRTDYETILRARPGITDLASILYRREEEVLASYPDPETAYVEEILPAKISLAKQYVERQSLALDLSILARTLLSVAAS